MASGSKIAVTEPTHSALKSIKKLYFGKAILVCFQRLKATFFGKKSDGSE